MHRLVLSLLACISFSAVHAMSMVNVQDEQGNTPLHRAVIEWDSCSKHIKKTTAELEHIKKYYKALAQRINTGVIHFKKKAIPNDAAAQKLAALKKEHEALAHMAKTVQIKHVQAIRARSLAYDTVASLIDSGSNINIPNNEGRTAEQLNPEMFVTLVYNPLKHALKSEEIVRARKLLDAGACPNFVVDGTNLALNFTMDHACVKSAALLLEYGANSTFNVTNGSANILHAAASTQNPHVITTLLTTPLGSPTLNTAIPTRLKKIYAQFYSFVLCSNRSGFDFPKEIKEPVLACLLPEPAELINLVSLQALPRYIKYFGKQALVDALTHRHVSKMNKALLQEMGNGFNPSKITRIVNGIPAILGIIQIGPANECTALLDPAQNPLERFKPLIEENYTSALNPQKK